MGDSFTVTESTDGSLEIRDAAGQVVEERPDNQYFWDFMTWSSMQPDPAHEKYRTYNNSYFFCDVDPFLRHIKKWQALLHTTPIDVTNPSERILSTNVEFSVHTETSLDSGHKVMNITKAVPRNDHPEFRISGFGGEDTSGFTGSRSNTWVTPELRVTLNHHLKDDQHEVRRISTWPIERCFVYLDVSDFSIKPSGHQSLIIRSIIDMVENNKYWEKLPLSDRKTEIEAMICIGDGYIFVFRDPLKATLFGALLAQLIEHLIAKKKLPVVFHFRMGIHVGRVFSFWDPGRGYWNYVGEGINGGQRVLGAIGKDTDDVLFVSAEVRQKIASDPRAQHVDTVLKNLHNRGRRADKHGLPWRVYEVNHTGIASLQVSYVEVDE